MKYPKRNYKSRIIAYSKGEGESIEEKLRRVLTSKEPIEDTAPLIYTDRKDGIIAAYDHRTDRFELARMAMDRVHASRKAEAAQKAEAAAIKAAEAAAKAGMPIGEA